MNILLIRYQVCGLLVSGDGEEWGYVAGSCGGGLNYLRVFMGQKLNLTSLKLRILG